MHGIHRLTSSRVKIQVYNEITVIRRERERERERDFARRDILISSLVFPDKRAEYGS